MTPDFPRRAELLELLASVRDGEITAEQLTRIEEILREDDRAAALYVEYVNLDVALHYRAGATSDLSTAVGPCRLPYLPATVEVDDLGLFASAAQGGKISPQLPTGPRRMRKAGAKCNSSSATLSFLRDSERRGRRFVRDHLPLCSVLAVLVIAGIIGSAVLRQAGSGGRGTANREREAMSNEQGSSKLKAENSKLPALLYPVARLTRVADCRWADQGLAPGDPLKTGQWLHLAAGVAEVKFDIGVRLVVQGPALLKFESADSARLEIGKVTAEIFTERARGFSIRTLRATFVDQGTEFGVEVAPGGSSRIHVFKGRVDVDMDGEKGNSPVAAERLMENVGARLEGDAPSMTLIADTGESFIRSLDQAGRDRHVVAYWRFEDRPLGARLPTTQQNSRSVRATADCSFNGNDLFTFGPLSQPRFSGDVPAASVPQTAAANRGCLDTSEPLEAHGMTRDVYTRSQFSHASPLDVQRITPAQWTVEASVKPVRLHHGVQTFVVRDGAGPDNRANVAPRLAFRINAEDHFAVGFRDGDGRLHEAVAANMAIQENHWYHTAATSDGRNLRLYVDALDGRGYQLRAATSLPRSGSTALGKGDDAAEWSIGRGKAAGQPAEWFQGLIDEVRICDVALGPGEFLFTEPAKSTAKHTKDLNLRNWVLGISGKAQEPRAKPGNRFLTTMYGGAL